MPNHLKKARIAVAVGTSAAAIGLGAVAPASATVTPAEQPTAKLAAMASDCRSWISGEWGHGYCTNPATYINVTMHLHVACNAFWDPDVHRTYVLAPGRSVELQGQCWSSVDSVEAYIQP
ncbi:MAG: hypothetical protein ACRC35_03485 [Angustibacter sp.]